MVGWMDEGSDVAAGSVNGDGAHYISSDGATVVLHVSVSALPEVDQQQIVYHIPQRAAFVPDSCLSFLCPLVSCRF